MTVAMACSSSRVKSSPCVGTRASNKQTRGIQRALRPGHSSNVVKVAQKVKALPESSKHASQTWLTNAARAAVTFMAAVALAVSSVDAAPAATGFVEGSYERVRAGHNGIRKRADSLGVSRMDREPLSQSLPDAASALPWNLNLLTPSRVPFWVDLVGLLGLNIGVMWGAQKLVQGMQDGSEPATVVKLQIGLVTGTCDLQERLGKLRSTLQMGHRGLWLLLEEGVLEVLRYQRQARFATVDSVAMQSAHRAYETFKELAQIEARSAEAEEAAVQHGHKKQQHVSLWPVAGAGATEDEEVIVVTLVVAARGVLDIPQVSSWRDVRHTLQQLSGVSSDRLMAVELLWTPQSREDSLSKQQMLRDYPDLVAIA